MDRKHPLDGVTAMQTLNEVKDRDVAEKPEAQ